jgi:hypothetical protein
MALVRCTCLARLQPGDLGPTLVIEVADPDCGYVVHRLAEDLPVEPTY